MTDLHLLKEDIIKGIKALKIKHGRTINETSKGAKDGRPLTNYQLQKIAGLPGKTIDNIENTGGITFKTLYKIAVGLNKKGSTISMINKVLKDMESK